MSSQLQIQRHCPICQAPRLFTKPGLNNLIHALVTIFTCGLWLFIWLIVALINSRAPYRCTNCGTPA